MSCPPFSNSCNTQLFRLCLTSRETGPKKRHKLHNSLFRPLFLLSPSLFLPLSLFLSPSVSTLGGLWHDIYLRNSWKYVTVPDKEITIKNYSNKSVHWASNQRQSSSFFFLSKTFILTDMKNLWVPQNQFCSLLHRKKHFRLIKRGGWKWRQNKSLYICV